MGILWPKEHGAYGQLLFPLGTALALGPRVSALALAAACIAAFVGHEALLTLLGQRGGRAARERRRDAIVSLACCVGVAAVLGVWAILRMAPPSRLFVALPVGLAFALALFIRAGREHTTAGESVAAVALSSCGVPVAMAGGVPASRALACWVVFALSFTLATLAVRAAIARVKNGNAVTANPARAGSHRAAGGSHTPAASVANVGSGIPSTPLRAGSRISRTSRFVTAAPMWFGAPIVALSIVSAARGWLPPAVPFALLPVCGVAAALSLVPPHPRHLRAVGWSLVAATAVTAVVLAVAV